MDTPAVHKTYEYKLKPALEQAMAFVVRRCRELYNAALQECRDGWHQCGVSISCAHQSTELPTIKDVRPEYHDVHSQVLQVCAPPVVWHSTGIENAARNIQWAGQALQGAVAIAVVTN